ncbi:hypothetical protein GUY60_24405, partial [Streptomyces sp. YC537]|nr:hypothetical protein [Streptomyces boluensis]
PAALQLGVDIAADGTADPKGSATVHGTVTCTQPVDVSVAGEVTQVVKGATVTGPYSTSVPCEPGRAVAWTASPTPTGDTPFGRGGATVRAQAFTQDPNYGGTVAVERTATVQLARP